MKERVREFREPIGGAITTAAPRVLDDEPAADRLGVRMLRP